MAPPEAKSRVLLFAEVTEDLRLDDLIPPGARSTCGHGHRPRPPSDRGVLAAPTPQVGLSLPHPDQSPAFLVAASTTTYDTEQLLTGVATAGLAELLAERPAAEPLAEAVVHAYEQRAAFAGPGNVHVLIGQLVSVPALRARWLDDLRTIEGALAPVIRERAHGELDEDQARCTAAVGRHRQDNVVPPGRVGGQGTLLADGHGGRHALTPCLPGTPRPCPTSGTDRFGAGPVDLG